MIQILREYTVFNADQCENLPDSVKAGKPMRLRNPDTRDALTDEFLRSTAADIREGHGEAYYLQSHDFISMPAFEAFKGADHFYNVAFHELTDTPRSGSEEPFRLARVRARRFSCRVGRRVPLRRQHRAPLSKPCPACWGRH